MTDLQKLNVRDFLDRLIYLTAQINAARKFSPVRLLGDYSETKVHIDDFDDFKEVLKLYKIDDSEINITYANTTTPMTIYTVHFRGLHITYCAFEHEKGFIPQEGEDNE